MAIFRATIAFTMSDQKPNIPEIFLKPYNPKEHEENLYAMWEDSGFFNPDTCVEKGVAQKDAETFSIVLPPPNVTGTLHMGHAAMLAIEDILVRYNRMLGKRTLWIPGTDSAAIATQAKVEKELYKQEKKSRHDLGREELLKRIETFTDESRATIINQVKRMGSSLDWNRYAYTMDDDRYHAVMEAFVRMYDAGLIYRANRIVNWDPKGQTTISDDEIVHEERQATFYTFKYWHDFPIAISTTRPETKVGDTAVAVHPDDERYKGFIGKEFTGEFAGTQLTIRIVADESVDKDFGTGALGVTPAHSHADWDIANRHDLPRPQVINEYAKMTDAAGSLVAGLKVLEAREKIVAWIKENNLLEKEESVTQNVSTAERTGGIIEPLPKLQWWIDVEKKFTVSRSSIPGIESGKGASLKEIMRASVESGATTIVPDRFNNVYYNWINNLRPWCISRQIWFGHRIPVWYCITCNTELFKKHFYDIEKGTAGENGIGLTSNIDEAGQSHLDIDSLKRRVSEGAPLPGNLKNPIVSTQPPNDCPVCNSDSNLLIQDPDVLDTWFSSGLWTFSTLGWPNETEDLKTYHPTSVLETGYDILFFWVARMILMSGFFLGEVPFKQVYLHGLVRDEKGRKMSKSLGNIIDPLDMIEKYGADATRLSLIVGAAPGNDVKLSEDKVRGYKHFANKIWNISRFVLTSIDGIDVTKEPAQEAFSARELEMRKEFHAVLNEVSDDIEQFRLYLAAEKAYHYLWHTFADVIIEESKEIMNGTDAQTRTTRGWLLYHLLIENLKMLHPFMPYVTEAIWQQLPHKESEQLMIAKWHTK